MTGLVMRCIGGFYTVVEEAGQTYTCKARGRFRKEGVRVIAGDRVVFSAEKQDEGWIEELLPRKNVSVRPRIANLDKLILVLASVPAPDWLLLDRLLVRAYFSDIRCILCVNKLDLDGQVFEQAKEQYGKAGYSVLKVCALTGEGIEQLNEELREGITGLAGQSGVGKSSVLNALFPEKTLEVGKVSERTHRGKHTTRVAELLPLENGGYVADTPGFSFLDLDLIDPEIFKTAYPEFHPYAADCRFLGCTHRKEPGCAVRQAVQAQAISESRHERYLLLYEETADKWRKKYE